MITSTRNERCGMTDFDRDRLGSRNELSIEERKWAFFAHLSALSGFVVPFGNLLGPLIIWQIKRFEMPFAAEQAKEALNFHITVSLAVMVCFPLFVVLVGLLLLPAVLIGAVVLTVVGAVKSGEGQHYRYPFNLRLVN